MSKLLETITEETMLSPTNTVKPVWEWHGSAEKDTVAVGHLREYGAGYLPVTATIRKQEEDHYTRQATYSLVINYNGAGCSKTIRPDRVKVAATRADVEDWAIDKGGEPASKEYIDKRMALIEKLLEDGVENGKLVETRDEAIQQLKDYATMGNWYEQFSDYDKMEVA